MKKLNPKIIEYLKDKLEQKENSIRTNISLLRRKQAGMTLNAVAHKYAMSFGYSAMRFLDQEDRATLSLPLEVKRNEKPKKPVEGNKKKNYNKFITPKTPYSNIISLKKIIEDSKDYLSWFDKHFSTKGFEILKEGLDGSSLKEIKILLSINSNMDFKTFKSLFERFKVEHSNINISCRVLCNKNVINTIHNRWIISKNFCYDIPPINSLYQGQYSEIKKTINRPPFEEWWEKGLDIIQDWNKIENAKEKTN